MEYKYPPIFKYIVFFIIVFLFLRYYKQITSDKYMVIAFVITLFIIILDYIIIGNQPSLFETSTKSEIFNNNDNNIDDVIEDERKYKDLRNDSKIQNYDPSYYSHVDNNNDDMQNFELPVNQYSQNNYREFNDFDDYKYSMYSRQNVHY